jgi:heme exporter protein C
MLGFINIPIVKFSVNLWNSLHQPASVFRLNGPSIHPAMLKPLMLIFVGFIFYFVINLIIKLKTNLIEQKIRRQKLQK